MPEQSTLSIKASLSRRAEAGLHATVLEHLSRAPAGERSRGGDVIHNSFTGTSNGLFIQAGKIYGDIRGNG